MANLEKLPVILTGTNVASLPVVAPSTGKAGYSFRWLSRSLIAQTDASVVPTWPSIKGGLSLVASGTAQPLKQTLTSTPYVSYDGSDDVSLAGTSGPLNATIHAIAIIFRVSAAPGVTCQILGSTNDSSDFVLGRTSGNNINLLGTGTATQSRSFSTAATWHCVVLNDDATAGSQLSVDGAAFTNATSGTCNGTLTSLEVGKGGASFGQVDVAEIIAYPTAVTAADAAAIHTAAQINYPDLSII